MTLATYTDPRWTPHQFDVWFDRYALRNEKGEQIEETPADTWQRVALAIANDKTEYNTFNDLLTDFKFVPGGRILSSAGAGNETMAYNCFVIPVSSRGNEGADSRAGIFDTINTMVNIMSRGGGVGINWSTLRPRGSHLSRVNGTSSGSVGWMDVASAAVGEVIQGGSRRGAAMFMLYDWHPDVLEFTNVKRDGSKITNANISVAVSDAFMQAVKNDDDWVLRFPDTKHPEYNSEWDGDINSWMDADRPVVVYQTLKARELWRNICEGAWHNGEPGVVFLERYNKMSIANQIEKIICVNPCGEQGLGAYSVCNLGSMNLTKYMGSRQVYVTGYPGGYRQEVYFDDEAFSADVEAAVRFLDNVIDKSYYMEDIPQMRESQMKLRRMGLGVMGLADIFATFKVRYGGPESVALTEAIFGKMKESALWASTKLAKEKGAAPGWDRSMLDSAPYLQGIDFELMQHIDKHGLRNLFLLTQAPTGTTSLLAGVNSGLEPFFALEYERNDRMGKRIVRPAPYQEWLDDGNILTDLGNVPAPIPDYFVTADKLSVEEHIAIQAAAQKYIDSSISKTVNAPNSHTVEDVDKLYQLCYDSGLKGISYFRDGCERAVVLSRNIQEEQTEKVEQLPNSNASPYVRPETVFGVTQRKRTKYGHAFVTTNFSDDNGPIEVFINVGRASTDISEWGESMGRLISLALMNRIPRHKIAEQLTGVGGFSKMQPSLSTAVAEALMDATVGVVPAESAHADGPAYTSTVESTGNLTSEICLQCNNASMVRAEGCMTCMVCGNSKC